MIIERSYSRFIVFNEDSIQNALNKINNNKSRIIFVVSESGLLEGIISDGDIRRWLLERSEIDLNTKVTEAMNRNFKFAFFDENKQKIAESLSEKIIALPLLDRNNRVVAVALPQRDGIHIDGKEISSESSCYIIAEIGNNHNGDIELAKHLVDLAIDSGADCVKFQMRDLDSLYSKAREKNDSSVDLGVQYTLDLLRKYQLSPSELFSVFDYCRERGITPLCTPWDEVSLERLEQYGMPAYKVASADFTNYPLLQKIAATGKVMICSTGMSSEAEIKHSIQFIRNLGQPFILLHCNSTYPAPFKDVNLDYMNHLREIGGCLVGYSGHERDIYVPIAAVAMGAKVIEKHFTVDKHMEGNDHKVSLLPDEFREMVTGIRQVELAIGSKLERQLTQGELMNRENLAKSLVAAEPIRKGTTITDEMVAVKSPGQGLQPNRLEELVGLKAIRNLDEGDIFFEEDLEPEKPSRTKAFHFDRNWGIPVRYHDMKQLVDGCNLDLLEIHLSYKDLELDFTHFIKAPYDLDLVVHAPELFANDHTLNLCSSDKDYRERSIRELQRVIDLTVQLKPFFLRSDKTLIVTNVGGFSNDTHLSEREKDALYAVLEESLAELNTDGVEIIPQTMPPFPWHFGGQQYHNIFMDPDSIVKFCEKNRMRVCLDVSHSRLACNHFKFSFPEFLKKVGPYVAHMHLADAKGSDGEGLQINDGDIDWEDFFRICRSRIPRASFIPEIWQGHKNNGQGCWKALSILEGYAGRLS